MCRGSAKQMTTGVYLLEERRDRRDCHPFWEVKADGRVMAGRADGNAHITHCIKFSPRMDG